MLTVISKSFHLNQVHKRNITAFYKQHCFHLSPWSSRSRSTSVFGWHPQLHDNSSSVPPLGPNYYSISLFGIWSSGTPSLSHHLFLSPLALAPRARAWRAERYIYEWSPFPPLKIDGALQSSDQTHSNILLEINII